MAKLHLNLWFICMAAVKAFLRANFPLAKCEIFLCWTNRKVAFSLTWASEIVLAGSEYTASGEDPCIIISVYQSDLLES